MTKRQKTSVETNVLLLDIPKSIIAKYNHKTYRDGKLFPILTNQKTNAYLKEIADLCGVKKNLTFHLARHTFVVSTIGYTILPAELCDTLFTTIPSITIKTFCSEVKIRFVLRRISFNKDSDVLCQKILFCCHCANILFY